MPKVEFDINNIHPEGPEQEAKLFRIMLLHGMLAGSITSGEVPHRKTFINAPYSYYHQLSKGVVDFWQKHMYTPQSEIMVDGLAQFAVDSVYASKDTVSDIELLEKKILKLSFLIIHKAESRAGKRETEATLYPALRDRYQQKWHELWYGEV